MSRLASLALAFVALGAVAGVAHGAGFEAAAPGVVFVGPPRAPAPVDRVDLARTGRSKTALPSAPVEILRRAVGAGAQPPVVLADGTVLVALSTPEVIRIAPDGAEASRTRIGSAPAARPPVVLSDGGVAVLTTAPSVVFLRRSGKVAATVALPKTTFPITAGGGANEAAFASLVPTPSGGVAVAAGRSFVELDASGRIGSVSTLPERERFAVDLVGAPGGWLAVSQNGVVYRLRPPAEPKRVGTFGAQVPHTPALADARTLLAQVGSGRVAALDLAVGATVTRVAETGLFGFDGAFVLDKKGAVWASTHEGLLLGFGAAGEEIARASVDRATAVPIAPPGRAPVPPSDRAVLLADAEGRVAFARSGGRVGVHSPDGRVALAPERGCQSPSALLPVAKGRMVLACKEGALVFYGDAGATR